MTEKEAISLIKKLVFHKDTNDVSVHKCKDDSYFFYYNITGFLNQKYFSFSIAHFYLNKCSEMKIAENVTDEIETLKKTFKL